jgi:MoxR-like ATPase
MVIATQNPIEHEGTYPLPEAQLDRFMIRLSIGYPTPDVEAEILATHGATPPLDRLEPVADAPGVAEMIEMAHRVHVAPAIRRYIVNLVEATRNHPDVYLGASPRASIMILRASRALAAADERDYVVPDDVKTLAPDVLRHRLVTTYEAEAQGVDAEHIVARLLGGVGIP